MRYMLQCATRVPTTMITEGVCLCVSKKVYTGKSVDAIDQNFCLCLEGLSIEKNLRMSITFFMIVDI